MTLQYWTIGEINKVIELANLGHTAREIAAAIGNGRTKNAIIGLLNRRKVSIKVDQKAQKARATRRKSTKRIVTSNSGEVFPVLNPVAPKVYGKMNILDAGPNNCRWIEGDGTMICGDPVKDHSSWCECHYARVFTSRAIAAMEAEAVKRRREEENWLPERKRF